MGSVRVILLSLFMIWSLVLQSQNPFDIKGRGQKTLESTKIEQLDSIKQEISFLESTRPILADPVIEEIEIEGENPFEVSHIPLRKSEFRKKKVDEKTKKEERSGFVKRNIPLFFIILSLFILALVIGFRDNVISKSLRAVYNPNFQKLIRNEAKAGFNRSYMLLYALFFINIAISFNHLFKTGLSDIKGFFLVFAAILIVYMVRHTSLWLLAQVFKSVGSQALNYSFSTQIGNIVLALVLLPLNIIMIYGFPNTIGVFLTIFLILVICAYLLRLAKGILDTAPLMVSNKIHFFLYLCACEIGPFLILAKVLRGLIY